MAMAGGGRLALAGAHEPRRACRAARSIISAVRRSSPELVRSGDDSVVAHRDAHTRGHTSQTSCYTSSESMLHVQASQAGEDRRTSTTFALTVLATGARPPHTHGARARSRRDRASTSARAAVVPATVDITSIKLARHTTPAAALTAGHRSEPPRRSARTLTSKRLHSSCTCAVGACDWSAQPS